MLRAFQWRTLDVFTKIKILVAQSSCYHTSKLYHFFFLLYSFRFSFFSLAGLKFHFIRAHSSVNNTKHMFTRYTPENSERGILTAVRPLHYGVFMSKDSYQHERFYEWIFSSTYRIRTTYTLSSHTPAHILFCLSRAHCINWWEIPASTGLTSETERISPMSFTSG